MAICPYCSPTSSSHLVRFVSAFKKRANQAVKKKRKSKKKKERKKNFLSSNVQIPVRNEPLPLTHPARIHVKYFAE